MDSGFLWINEACVMDRVVRQMGVARRRLDIAVAEQLADHRLRLAERQGTGREAKNN